MLLKVRQLSLERLTLLNKKAECISLLLIPFEFFQMSLLIIILVIIRRIFEAVGLICQYRLTEGEGSLSLDRSLAIPGSSAAVPLGFGGFLLWSRHERKCVYSAITL